MLLSFRRSDPELPTVAINGFPFREPPLSLSDYSALNSTQISIGTRTYDLSLKMAGKMVGSLYLTTRAILSLYKERIWPKMDYCCHIWTGDSRSPLSSLDTVQRRLRIFVGEILFSNLHLFQRCNVASFSLLYRYFLGKHSEDLYSLVPPVLIFTAGNCHALHIVANHSVFQ